MVIPGRRGILIRSSTVILNLTLGAVFLTLIMAFSDSLKVSYTVFLHTSHPSPAKPVNLSHHS